MAHTLSSQRSLPPAAAPDPASPSVRCRHPRQLSVRRFSANQCAGQRLTCAAYCLRGRRHLTEHASKSHKSELGHVIAASIAGGKGQLRSQLRALQAADATREGLFIASLSGKSNPSMAHPARERWCGHLQPTYIQEIQVVAPPKWQVYTGAPCGGPKDLSLSMHSQRDMNYTHRAARGDVASAAIPVSISATAAQWRSEQHTAADRVRAHGGAASSAS